MKRSKFSLSHYKLMTCDMGALYPVTWYEALPGDTLQMSNSLLIRSTPLMAPVMHPVRVRLHTWFVPNRLIWEDWEDFITGGEDGLDQSEHPWRSYDTVSEGSTPDYLGIAPGDYSGHPGGGIKVSALPIRAYTKIYNEFYRDQDLVSEKNMSIASGEDTTTQMGLYRVAWEKDYFTTARPWTQKGQEIRIPLGDSAPIIADGNMTFGAGADTGRVLTSGAGTGDVNAVPNWTTTTAMDFESGLIADLQNATGITVNDLRNYLALQRYQEARAQFGSRYSEYLKYLVPGIGNLDSRLQEPEYIHGGSSIISFSEVLQTAELESEPAQGNESFVGTMRGHGISAMRTRRARKFCPEHGIVMTLLSVVPKAIYTQQVERKWNRTVKEQYFQKELQFIGEQPILNKEVLGTHTDPDGTFGFNNRYDEYRYIPSDIAGEFHSTYDYWHYGRIHSGDVALNQSFIECLPSKRAHADVDNDQLYVMCHNSIQARRVLTKWPKPRTF